MDFFSGASSLLFFILNSLRFFHQSDGALLHQYFRVRPTDMEVVEGTQIEINCHVANRAGAVQWSKDGFVLGFQATIPGFPRYEMVTNESRGIYNLRITSVQLEDEGEYQCQVGPARDMEPIRGKAHLTVLVPPKRLEIRHYANGSAVQVKEGERVTLICRAHESRPAAQLKWYRDGQLLSVGSHHITHDEKARGRRRTTISVLIFHSKMEDHGIVYGCHALHIALRSPQITTVYISILHAPQSPKIEGYKNGEVVQVGDKLNILCISRGGNPPPVVLWYRNDVLLDKSYRNTPKETTNSLTFVVGGNDNNAELRCESHNEVTNKPLAATIRIRVLYSPTKVTLLGPTEAIVGNKVTVMCMSAPSNPPVEIYWMVDGRPVVSHQSVEESGPQGWVTSSNVTVLLTRQDPLSKTFTCHAASETLGETLVKSTTVNVLQPPGAPTLTGYHEGKHIISGELQRLLCQTIGGNPLPSLRWYKGSQELQGTMTISGTTVTNELLYRVQASDNGAIYRCEATNPALTHPLVTTISTNVYFGPLSISLSLLPTQPKAGEEVTIICETGSSNPKASVIWLKDDVEVKSVGEKTGHGEYGGRTVRNLLKLNLTADDNGSKVTCRANNEVIAKKLDDSLLLSVLFKPQFLVANKQIFNVTEGKSSMVNMTAIGNPPSISYVWYKVLNDGSESEVRTSASGGNHRFIYRGPVLHMFGVMRRDEGWYICQASNNEGATNTSLLISVLYPAKVKKITTSVVLHEGDNAYLECFVEGNPLRDDMIKWRRDGFDMLRSQQFTDGGVSHLTVFNVSRYDSGTFLCVADNGISEESVGTTQIFVKFLPNIVRDFSHPNVASSIGEMAAIPCLAEGYPPVTFVWSRNGEVLGSSDKFAVRSDQTNPMTWKSVLHIQSVGVTDYGYYTCVAQNALGTDHTNLKLRERGRPDPPRTVHVVNYSSTSVVIKWDPGFDGGDMQQFQIQYSPLHSTSYFASDVLSSNATHQEIRGLEPSTVYTFYVHARNSYGTCDQSFNQVTVKTLAINHSAGAEAATSDGQSSARVTAVIVVSLLSSVLLVCNAILVTFFVRKRKKNRLMQKKSNTYQDEASNMMCSSGNSSELPPDLFLQRTREPRHREPNMTDRAKIKNYKRNSERNRESVIPSSLEDVLLEDEDARRREYEDDILGVPKTRLIPLSYSLLEADPKCPDVMQNTRYLHPL